MRETRKLIYEYSNISRYLFDLSTFSYFWKLIYFPICLIDLTYLNFTLILLPYSFQRQVSDSFSVKVVSRLWRKPQCRKSVSWWIVQQVSNPVSCCVDGHHSLPCVHVLVVYGSDSSWVCVPRIYLLRIHLQRKQTLQISNRFYSGIHILQTFKINNSFRKCS